MYRVFMGILIGETGLVGKQILLSQDFEIKVHRPTLKKIENISTDLLVCAGLPAEKWLANKYHKEDWANIETIVNSLEKVKAERAILISTIDVFQPAINVFDDSEVNQENNEPYGKHRAMFEVIFKSLFDNPLILRLPGLFSPRIKKNFVFDLLNSKNDYLTKVNPASEFQFFDLTKIWPVINRALDLNLEFLNVTSEPIFAEKIANLFGIKLVGQDAPIKYNMKTKFSVEFGGSKGYIYTSEDILQGIQELLKFKF